MSKIFFDCGISLDGLFAGENRDPDNPIGDGGTSIHNWMYKQKAFYRHPGLEGGEEDETDSLVPLAESISDITDVVLPDIHGYGESVCRQPLCHTWSQYTEDLIRRRLCLSIEER